MKNLTLVSLLFFLFVFVGFITKDIANKKQELTKVLGDFPEPPELQIDNGMHITK